MCLFCVDFGLPSFRDQDNLRKSEEGMEMRKQLSHIYCPPEMKGQRHDAALQVTPATDVYRCAERERKREGGRKGE